MKTVCMIIAFMLLVSVLCATPATAFTGDNFKVLKWKEDGTFWHKYRNMAAPDDKYIEIHPSYTMVLDSFVTFKPANIPDAPVMGVHTYLYEDTSYLVLLPQSVDEWEIKYYSTYKNLKPCELLNDKYLKNAGVVNLNEFFGDHISEWLYLEVSTGQYLCTKNRYYGEIGYLKEPIWAIPDCDEV